MSNYTEAGNVGARASWSAATESSESQLWLGVVVSRASFGILSAARAKAVTSRTPSPQSKTWRQNDRFLETGWWAVFKAASLQFIRSRRSGLDRRAFSGEINLGERRGFPEMNFTVEPRGVDRATVFREFHRPDVVVVAV